MGDWEWWEKLLGEMDGNNIGKWETGKLDKGDMVDGTMVGMGMEMEGNGKWELDWKGIGEWKVCWNGNWIGRKENPPGC